MNENEPKTQRPPRDGEPKKPKLGLPFVILAVIMILLLVQLVTETTFPRKSMDVLWTAVNAQQITQIEFSGETAKVTLEAVDGKDPERFRVDVMPKDIEGVKERLNEQVAAGRKVVIRNDPQSGFLSLILIWILPLVVLGLFFWWMMKRMGPPQGVMNFGKSRAKVYAEKEVHVTFGDVAGCEEAIEEVREIVEFLKEPKKFQALGARIPKGVLLLGAPGTGKTLLARAVAGEAGVPFFSLSGSDFVEMFVGVGASRVRDLFQQAEQQAPCLVFIDELDALGKTRGTSPVSNDEREQTLNALLVEMDGFTPNNGVIIIAATNRPEILDPALLRPGRFDRQVVVDRPDVTGRRKILEVHARKVRLDPSVDLGVIAKRTPGFVGADLANVINEAALLAARRGKKTVTREELEEAIDRVMIGLKKQRRGMNLHEKEIVATHETGHAVASYYTPGTDPVHRISIIPRGPSTGGHTMSLPEEERMLYTKDELLGRIVGTLGGRAAEFVVYGHLSTGASNDLEVASRLARYMVTRYGMSEKVGPVSLESEGSQYLRDPFARSDHAHSEDTQKVVDDEVREIIQRCEKRAIDILTRHRDRVDHVRGILMEKEILEREEFERLMADGPASPEPQSVPAPVGT